MDEVIFLGANTTARAKIVENHQPLTVYDPKRDTYSKHAIHLTSIDKHDRDIMVEPQRLEKEQQVSPCQGCFQAGEKKSMQSYIVKLERALIQKNGGSTKNAGLLQDQVAILKAQIQSQDGASRMAIRSLHKRNLVLLQEKDILESCVVVLKDDIRRLKAEILGLTEDVVEREKLRKKVEAVSKCDEAFLKKNKKLRKSVKESERRIKNLVEACDDRSRKVEELEAEHSSALTHHEATLVEKDERIHTLQEQNARFEKGFRERGELLIQSSRDSGSKAQLKREKKAAVEANGLLQTRVAGMFNNYRALHEMNATLVKKLTAMAEAGGFGKKGTVYCQELDKLKGQPLSELCEYKNKV